MSPAHAEPSARARAASHPLAVGNTDPVYAFAEEDCREWYRRLAADVPAAVGERRFLPVYRMGTGSFRSRRARRNGGCRRAAFAARSSPGPC